MVKITSTTGDKKTGVQGPAVYQGRYGRQIRRMRAPKGAPSSKAQLKHRDLFRLSLAWKKTLTPHDRAWLKWHATDAGVIDSFNIPLTWNRYADRIVLSHPQFRRRYVGEPPSLVLEVYHPALLQVILTREGEGEQKWGELSSLENEYITTEVHLDVQPEDVIQVKTLPGVCYTSIVPGKKEEEMIPHHETHEDGGDDEINVQGLSGILLDPQRPDLANADWGVIMDFHNWTELVQGTGSTIRDFRRLQLNTGATANSTAGVYFPWYPDPLSFDKDIYHAILYSYGWVGSINAKFWMKHGQGRGAADPTGKSIGFRVDYNALRGMVHDGANLHVFDLGVTLGIGDNKLLEIKFTAGSKIEWYVDGEKKGESIQIPSGTLATPYLAFTATNGATGGLCITSLFRWAYKLEWFYL